jgi:hypothetical protein
MAAATLALGLPGEEEASAVGAVMADEDWQRLACQVALLRQVRRRAWW